MGTVRLSSRTRRHQREGSPTSSFWRPGYHISNFLVPIYCILILQSISAVGVCHLPISTYFAAYLNMIGIFFYYFKNLPKRHNLSRNLPSVYYHRRSRALQGNEDLEGKYFSKSRHQNHRVTDNIWSNSRW